ncbi:MAG: hypothetical protein MUC92_06920 [Fimbriimonadaceae bacterium]|nr:hypothetical protein [Fimbriimonadaceae bacterium]
MIHQIVEAVGQVNGVLEIGPGPGVLTRFLQPLCNDLAVLELDERMGPLLGAWAPHAKVIWGDVLKVNLQEVLSRLPEPRVVVSNMPYNITGPLLQAISDQRNLWSKAVLMMQAEVAEKILAQPGDRNRGAISVVFESLFAIRVVSRAPGGAFMPPPKVDSIVLEFVPLPRTHDRLEQAFLEKLVKAGFSSPRKTLANNLIQGGLLVRENVPPVLAGWDRQIRPHQLSLADWEIISRRVAEFRP